MRNKGKKLEWNERAQRAFKNIKQEQCKAPVLGMPTEKCRYVLDTDASVVAVSGMEYCIRGKIGIGELFSIPLHTQVKYCATLK